MQLKSSHRHSTRRVIARVTIAIALFALPELLAAQSDASTNRTAAVRSADSVSLQVTPASASIVAATSVSSGPQISPIALTRFAPAVPAAPPAPEDNINVGQNVALMAVGVAAVVTGVIIGGNGGGAIAVTGGVVGLIGLYRYLR